MKSKLTLALVFALCVFPIVGATYLYRHRQQLQMPTVNNGHLFKHIVSIEDLAFGQTPSGSVKSYAGKWLLMYVANHDCGELCQNKVYLLHQIHTALGKDRSRLHNLLVVGEAGNNDGMLKALTQKYHDVDLAVANPIQQQEFKQTIKSADAKALDNSQDQIYLVDPHGNLVLSYHVTVKPKAIFKDLKRLLKVSQIG